MTLSLESLTRLISLNDTKANVAALTGTPTEIIVARATDTGEIGIYAGGSWHWVGSGAGTVTSVALTVPAEFSIAGSPVTSSGTLAITKATETANTVWAGPTSGSAAQPAFRALVAADIPAEISGGVTDHEHIVNVVFSGDASATVWELPAAPVDASSIAVYIAGSRSLAWVLSGVLLTTLTFDSAPASATNNIVIDIVAATA